MAEATSNPPLHLPPEQTPLRGKPIGEIHDDTLPIIIRESVLDEILEYSERNLDCELGGLMIGDVREGPRPKVDIRHYIPAVDADSKVATLRFTHETWVALNREREANYPGDKVVGWHHTHPGFGVFLSPNDKFIHQHFFSEVWQVALVVDPRRQELGFFQWRLGEIVDCGFICIFEDEAPVAAAT